MLIKKVVKYGGWVLLTTLLVSIGITTLVFPSVKDFRTLIRNAKSIELHYIPAPNYTSYFVMATISSTNQIAIKQLSESIKIRGVWLPFTEVSGNVYRCRITKDDGSWEDINLLGSDKIKYGQWCIPIFPMAVATVKRLVVDNGGHLPTKDVLVKLLKTKIGTKLVYDAKKECAVVKEDPE